MTFPANIALREPGSEHVPADRYARIARQIAAGRCVILDGAVRTELSDAVGTPPDPDERLWGLSAILDSPAEVKALHRRYIDVGCDVITTDTWGLPTALHSGGADMWEASRPVHWMDIARRGVRLARDAAADVERGEEIAVAFSLNGDVDGPDASETVRLIARALAADPPDLILLETLSLVRSSTYATVQALVDTGLPVWLSFRRCRHGLCGVYGEHWGGPEGDAFGRAARRFEELGVAALLINCVPPDHVTGMLSWLRDFTDLPLGVYPNLGYLSVNGWRSETDTGPPEYARLALQWREEGAQIIGGCCGVGPAHVAAARAVLADTKPGQRRKEPAYEAPHETPRGERSAVSWTDRRGREVFPLDFPDIAVDAGVFAPTPGSFFIWSYLYREGIGAHQRCLDVGSGSGLLTVQLARNGAAHVHAIDIEAAATHNTLANAFRNGVADTVTAATVDLYPWEPEESYDLIVASLYQMPVDPFEQVTTHRPLDFWGRNLLDHLIRLLPSALAEDGVAYIMQLSIIGQQRTAQLLEQVGFCARVVDFTLVEMGRIFAERSDQISRVEDRSDAYHIRLGDRDVVVAYLLELTRRVQPET